MNKFRKLDDAELGAAHGGWAQFVPPIVNGLARYGGNPGGAFTSFSPLAAAGRAWDAASEYLSPSPGQGAPGDTYHPATMNPNGTIEPHRFTAPPSDPSLPQVPRSSDASPAEPSTQFASSEGTPTEGGDAYAPGAPDGTQTADAYASYPSDTESSAGASYASASPAADTGTSDADYSQYDTGNSDANVQVADAGYSDAPMDGGTFEA